MQSCNKTHTPEYIENVERCVAALEEHGTHTAAAKALGIKRRTFSDRIKKSKELVLDRSRCKTDVSGLELPNLPLGDFEPSELIDHLCKQYSRREERTKALKWMPVKAPENAPIGIAIFGDPHLDNPGTNWPLLKRHAEICKNTPGLYAANIGDSTDNWVGRLQRLYAHSEVTRKQANMLIQWFLHDSGIAWFLWLHGNHDLWNAGEELLRAQGCNKILMEDWSAQFQIVFPNDRACRIWAQHDFKGHSMWNTLHGMQKAAHMKEWAHLYVGGHTHNWALHQEESASKDFTYWLARARGYKYMDSHAEMLGHQSQEHGATILAVIDPNASGECNFIQCFADLELGADFLTFLRKRARV